ncbi:MAG: UDP-N-acetylmuramoyl-L-alanine--D-glutamate ligase [Candidatus Cloacimonadota bacterium]|nr:MAG: UDP-N-acetylmuramoyl-L-alanine--D-glutamate ligase [Candidatus Cloacimonadota bacterium]
MDLRNKKFSVLGIARSGLAVAELIESNGGKVFLSDKNNQESLNLPDSTIKKFDCEFGGHSDKIFDCDYLIVSPGVPLNINPIKEAERRNIKIINEIELGYEVLGRKAKIIAVTGSNGKSTVTSLIYHLLKSAGLKVVVGGNIGIPFTSCNLIEPEYDFVVLELSSFQLDLISSFRPDVAVLTNITPDHLNRYRDFEDYALSKFRIFMNQTEEDKAVVFIDDPVIKENLRRINSSLMCFSDNKEAEGFSVGENEIKIGNRNISLNNMKIKGPHNRQNTMAALLAVSGLGIDLDEIIPHLDSFYPLEHRLEEAGIKNGIKFINDSKATNTDSVRFALMSYDSPIHVILGGSDKGEDFSVLMPYLRDKTKEIYLIGETKQKMKDCFSGLKYSECDSMEDAVFKAFKNAEWGEVVLLSPACASFDMFENFEDRGKKFKEIVSKL